MTILRSQRGHDVTPLTQPQEELAQSLENNTVVFATGPAGTGKTHVAVSMALQALRDGKTDNILMTRPAVQAGHDLGFLPGDLEEKFEPHTRAFESILKELCDRPRRHNLKEGDEGIEYQTLGFLRGHTIESSYAILDEAQNATEDQLRMFLTRLGEDAKAIVTGDPEQTDLDRPSMSALSSAERLLSGVNDITFVNFEEEHIVRNDVVKGVIQAYRREYKRRARERESSPEASAPKPEKNLSDLAERYQQHQK